jgi:hypothetical protein
MSDTAPAAESELRYPGHFWRRFFALFIDWLLIAFIVGVIGLLLFKPTDGNIRVSSVLWQETTCYPLDSNFRPTGLPEGFRLTKASYCLISFLGITHDRKVFMHDIREHGSSKFTWTLHVPVDNAGNLTQAIYLDNFLPLLFAAYVWLMEWKLGATLGKDFLKLRVRSLIRPDGRLEPSQAAMRLVRYSPLLLVMIGMEFHGGDFYLIILILSLFSIATLIVDGLAAFAMFKNRLPWYDRWANTAVILGRDQSIPAGAPAPA